MTCPPCTHDCEQGKTCSAKSKDEIIAMAIQAGATPDYGRLWLMYAKNLEAFAKLVAAKEREACAKLVGEFAQNDSAYELATIIGARGQA